MKFRLKNLILTFLLCLVFFSQKAHAYLDPGTGSMIFQVIAASIITVLCTCKSIICKLFKKNRNDDIEQ